MDEPLPLRPQGTQQEHFALMLHDRLLDLERELRELRPPPLDARLRLLGTRTASDSGAVFARVHARRAVKDVDAWAARVLGRLGRLDDRRADLWCCHHWSPLGGEKPYVIECLIERSGPAPASVIDAGHAILDAINANDDTQDVIVDVSAVTAAKWFAECVRSAAAASGRAKLHAWEPETGTVVVQDVSDIDEMCAATPAEAAAWTRLHGWLAAQTDYPVADLWHPRAPAASRMAADLVRALAAGA